MSSNRYPPALRGRAVRVIPEQCGEYFSEPDAIRAIAPKTGCHTGTLRARMRRHEQKAPGNGLRPDNQRTSAAEGAGAREP